MKKIFLLLTVLFSSCSSIKTFYQVYNVESDGLMEENGSLLYVNEDCDISYNFWGRSGNAGFMIHNKTDHDLFVDLSRSFFVKNGIAYDYYKNREYIHSGASGISSSSAALGSSNGVNINSSQGFTIAYKEKPVICIPAGTTKQIQEYSIMSDIMKECNIENDYPKTVSIPVAYSMDNTPLIFSNIISYSYTPNCESLKRLENVFWISEIRNYSSKEARAKEYIEPCSYDDGGYIYRFKMASPHKFYNQYEGESKTTPRGNLINDRQNDDDLYYE